MQLYTRKGVWKFNCSLLKDKDYVIKINNPIDDKQQKYSTHTLTPKTEIENTAISNSFF